MSHSSSKQEEQNSFSGLIKGNRPQAGDDDRVGSKRFWSFIHDKKRFAWALLSILKNNLVSAPLFYTLVAIEYLELVFLYIVFAFLFYDQSSITETDPLLLSPFLTSTQLFVHSTKVTIKSIITDISDNVSFQIVVIAVVFFIDAIFILAILTMAQKFESPETAKKPSTLAKSLSVFIHIKSKIIFTVEIILLAHIFKNDKVSNSSSRALLYAGGVICISLSTTIEVILNLVYNIRVRLLNEIPWCSQRTFTPAMKSLFKVAQGIALAVNSPQVTAIVLFLLSILSLGVYIFFQPHYNKKMYYLNVIFQSILFSEYFHLVVVSFDSRSVITDATLHSTVAASGAFSSMVTVLLFFLSILTPPFFHIVCLQRQERLQNNLLGQIGTMKSDYEIEKALVLFTECLERSGNSSASSSAPNSFNLIGLPVFNNGTTLNEQNTALNKQITGLILYHRERCREFVTKKEKDKEVRQPCFCSKFDDSLTANRLILQESKLSNEKQRFRRELSVKRSIANFMQDESRRLNHKKSNDALVGVVEEEIKEEEARLSSNVGQELDDFTSEGSRSDLQQPTGNYKSRKQYGLPPKESINQDRKSMTVQLKGERVEKDIDWQQEEQKQFIKGIINPIFQAEFYISQLVVEQRKEQSDFTNMLPDEVQNIIAKHNNDLSILDFSAIKVQTVISILYKIIRDQVDQNNKNLRLMIFKAYFELFIMRKKYLAHQTLTRMQGEETLSLLDYTQFQIDQQYLVEKAATLYQTKEDQLIDVEKIIQMNHQYQHFYDLNEETAFQLNIFWTQLSNIKTIDIEKLFGSGVKTSELIKQTKDKFQDLVSLGLDKRNSNLYYLYANFNRFVLNSMDLYNDYMYKMKQIVRMNNTLQDNTYKDQLNSDVDKSGFIIVKGTFADFGKMLYANHKLCQMLGYTTEQLNNSGKTINMLMPQIISECHHRFLNSFRESGVPVFIQKQQNLYVKNASGYIVPLKVYIKFHYDKLFGHVFCGIVNTVKHIHPFKNKKKLLCDDILTIVTDDLGTICEITPSVTQMFGIPIKFVQQNQMFLQDNVKIWHLFRQEIQQQLECNASREVYTTINPEFHTDSDLGKPVFAAEYALQALGRIPKTKGVQSSFGAGQSFNIQNALHLDQMQVDIKVKMAKVRHKDLLTVRYFFIEIMQGADFVPATFDIPKALAQPQNFELIMESDNLSQNFPDSNDYNTREDGDDTRSQIERKNSINNRIFDDQGSSNSSNDSASKFADLVEKDIDSLIRNDKRTPKILKQILWLVLFAFLTTTIISAIIMGLFVGTSNSTKSGIQTLTQALQRSIYCDQVMTLLRSLINHNLGYESDSVLYQTQIWTGISSLSSSSQPFSIDTYLSNIIIEKLNIIKDRQQSLTQTEQSNGIEQQHLPIQVINSQGQVSIQPQSPDVAINVLVSSIIDIVSNIALLHEVQKLNISFSPYYNYYNQLINQQSLLPDAYKLVTVESEIYYVFENFVNVVDQFNNRSVSAYLNQGTSALNSENTDRFLILICIAIGTLLITLLLVSPVTLKIRRQKYQVLQFFLGLDEDIIKQCCLKSTIFESKFSSEQFLKGPAAYFQDGNSEDFQLEQELDEDLLFDSTVDDQSSMAGGIEMTPHQFQEQKKRAEELQKKTDEYKRRIEHDNMVRKQRASFKPLQSKKTVFNDSDFVSAIVDVDLLNGHKASQEEIKAQKLSQLKFNNGIKSDMEKKPRLALPVYDPYDSGKYKIANQVPKTQFSLNTSGELHTEMNFNQLKTINEEMGPDKVADQKEYETFGPQQHKLQEKGNKSVQISLPKRVNFKNGVNSRSKDNLPKLLDALNNSKSYNDIATNSQIDISRDELVGQEGEGEHSMLSEEMQKAKENKENLQQKIKNISTQSQSSIFIVILLLFVVITCYFIGIYIYTSTSISEYQSSFYDLETVHLRSICLSKLFFQTREDIMAGQEAPLTGQPIQGYKSLSMDRLWQCMSLEQSFTEIKRSGKSYLQNSQGDISSIDSLSFCDLAAAYSSYGITPDVCHSIKDGVFDQGLSIAHQNFIKSVLITLLGYYSSLPSYNASETPQSKMPKNTVSQFIQNDLNQPPLLEYLYSNELILSDVNAFINSSVISSITKYIDTLINISIAFFSALQVMLIIVIIYFFARMFNRMKKDMLSSHLMIAMLPKNLLQKKDHLQIKEFLLA